jgi:hypothetical protein
MPDEKKQPKIENADDLTAVYEQKIEAIKTPRHNDETRTISSQASTEMLEALDKVGKRAKADRATIVRWLIIIGLNQITDKDGNIIISDAQDDLLPYANMVDRCHRKFTVK